MKADQHDGEVVIERVNMLYGQGSSYNRPSASASHQEQDEDSDNFSMCSEVIRDMNTHDEFHMASEYV